MSGFLSGVLPGYESGLDHFERTNSLLGQVCNAVSPIYFYTCLWECVATNASVRLPAVSYLIDHFNKRIGMDGQKYVMGKNKLVMMSGLCACLNDSVILVQRNTLEFLLLGFPLHTDLLSHSDLIKLVTNGLNTILRRDMSLNRRLYAWLLGSEVNNKNHTPSKHNQSHIENNEKPRETYFNQYSKEVLIKALQCTLKNSLLCDPVDLSPYRILVSLLDKVEIGPVVLDDVLCDVIRTMALSNGTIEVGKSANLLFATFDPSYIWNYMTQQYEKSCKLSKETSRLALNLKKSAQKDKQKFRPEVDSGPPSLVEVCYLTEFLLETISLEMYNETTRVYLPKVFLAITQMLTIYVEDLTNDDITASLKLCMKIVSRVQPMVTYPERLTERSSNKLNDDKTLANSTNENGNGLEKSKSDSKLNQASTEEEESIKRSNSNQNMSKNNSPKKTKKSKSYSKLLELDKEICSDTGQLIIPNAKSTPNLEFQNSKQGKFAKNSKKSPKGKSGGTNSKSLDSNSSKSSNINENADTLSLDRSETSSATTPDPSEHTESGKNRILIQETTLQEYSILEKCIKQYEIFYQVFVSQQILNVGKTKKDPVCSVRVSFITDICIDQDSCLNENIIEDPDPNRNTEIDKIFETLKKNVKCRQSRLYALLNKTISIDISDDLNQNESSTDVDIMIAEECVCRLMELKLNEQLREAVKLASNLLVDMSTFPNYNQNLVIDYTDSELPCWLKVLSLTACYTKSDKELQISAISTLFELIRFEIFKQYKFLLI